DDLGAIVSLTAPRRILVALDDRRGRLPVRRLLEARVRGVAVEDGSEILERLTGKIAIEAVSPGALAFSRDFSSSRGPEAPAAAPAVEFRALQRDRSLLLAPLAGAARGHRVGPGPLRVREQSRGRDREDALRPLLHQASLGAPGLPHPPGHRQGGPPGARRRR